jgi:hypothetical protein
MATLSPTSNKEQIFYRTYTPYIPEYMSGYTGHIPHVQKEEYINRIVHTKHIPGYMGFVSSIKAENKFGESYGKETAESLAGTIPKGADVPPYVRYTSTAREDYKDQSKVKTQSTAQLLGISEPNVVYKKSIPVDTINKFFGVHGKTDKENCIMEKQSYERDYEKFWEFLDSNDLDYIEKKPGDINESNMAYWGVQHSVQELHPELKYDPIPGYMGTNRSIVSENIFGMTYKNSLRRADELLEKIKMDKAAQLYKSSTYQIKY